MQTLKVTLYISKVIIFYTFFMLQLIILLLLGMLGAAVICVLFPSIAPYYYGIIAVNNFLTLIFLWGLRKTIDKYVSYIMSLLRLEKIDIEKLSFYKRIRNFFLLKKDISNSEAASIIRNYIDGKGNPKELDGFENISHINQEVKLAQYLCWYYADKYPSDSESEYRDTKAEVSFFKITDALDNNKFGNINIKEAFASLRKNMLTDGLKILLEDI